MAWKCAGSGFLALVTLPRIYCLTVFGLGTTVDGRVGCTSEDGRFMCRSKTWVEKEDSSILQGLGTVKG